MRKVCAVGASLRYTPWSTDVGQKFFLARNVEFTSAQDAQLIISGTLRKLLTYMFRFGWKKKYLLWTIEPRFNTSFSSVISYPLLPPVHLMNLYAGIFKNNYYFTPQKLICFNPDEFEEFKNRRIVSLMTYQAGKQWRLNYQGTDLDLCNLRTEIALKGYKRDILDIYGRNWPQEIKTHGQSRGQGWREKKLDILDNYHFNLCFENTNWPYYCTEKIWHSIQGQCLPVYYGKGNRIYDDFPKDSFLDYANYDSVESLFDHIENMSISEFRERLAACTSAFNSASERAQAEKPYQQVLHQSMQKMEEILA